MWRDRRVGLGLLLGMVLAALALTTAAAQRRGSPASTGRLLSDCDGSLAELVIQYIPEAADVVTPAYRDFLRQLPADTVVHVACPDEAACADLLTRVGPVACRLVPRVVGHAMTTWSRDRWLALDATASPGDVTLLLPRGENGAAAWPARQGDQRVGFDLARLLGPTVDARRSGLLFDGGDFVADARTVFVTPGVLRRNLQHTVGTREELLRRLEARLRKRVVLLDEAPDHHAGMYLMAIGDDTMLVGDPSLARGVVDGWSAEKRARLFPSGGPDRTAETQRRFDAVARQVAAAGYHVKRVPVVPGADGRTWLTYLNGVLDERGGQRTVYLPVFRGAEPLNAAAVAVWREAGYTVRQVDCTAAYVHFGSLRCLVNVLRRSAA